MLTLKVIYPLAEAVFEAKSFMHFPEDNRIDGTDSLLEPFSIYLNSEACNANTVYVMNSSGATVGVYRCQDKVEL